MNNFFITKKDCSSVIPEMNNFFITKDWKDITPVEDWHRAYMELLKEKQKLDKSLDEACEALEMYSKELYDITDGIHNSSALLRQVPVTMWTPKEWWKELLIGYANK